MTLTQAAVTKIGVDHMVSANNMLNSLSAAAKQIADHNADKNNKPIDAAPVAASLAAVNTIIGQMAAHVQTSVK